MRSKGVGRLARYRAASRGSVSCEIAGDAGRVARSRETRDPRFAFIDSRQRILASIIFLLFLAACGGREKSPQADKPPENAKVHALKGKIISRDANAGTLTIAHEAIPGTMEAMTMPFPVRGAKIEDLPPDGTMIEAQLHLAEMSYWITDVRESPPKP